MTVWIFSASCGVCTRKASCKTSSLTLLKELIEVAISGDHGMIVVKTRLGLMMKTRRRISGIG